MNKREVLQPLLMGLRYSETQTVHEYTLSSEFAI